MKITAYFESLCPDSINFMMEQLAPLMGEFNRYPDWLTLDLIPFGFENVSNKKNTYNEKIKKTKRADTFSYLVLKVQQLSV